MQYPNAYCVKCKTHTPTKDKHTVLLQNSARALVGVCPVCDSQNYKILPKKELKELTDHRNTLTGQSLDGYCFKCRHWVDVDYAQSVVLQNGSNALKGHCHSCQGDVYKIVSAKESSETKSQQRYAEVMFVPPVSRNQKLAQKKKGSMSWSGYSSLAVVIAIAIVVMIYLIYQSS